MISKKRVVEHTFLAYPLIVDMATRKPVLQTKVPVLMNYPYRQGSCEGWDNLLGIAQEAQTRGIDILDPHNGPTIQVVMKKEASSRGNANRNVFHHTGLWNEPVAIPDDWMGIVKSYDPIKNLHRLFTAEELQQLLDLDAYVNSLMANNQIDPGTRIRELHACYDNFKSMYPSHPINGRIDYQRKSGSQESNDQESGGGDQFGNFKRNDQFPQNASASPFGGQSHGTYVPPSPSIPSQQDNQTQGFGQAQSQPQSPFSQQQPMAAPAPSPFSQQQPMAAPAPSPFAQPAAPQQSPFAQPASEHSQPASGPQGSPFGQQPAQQPASPFASPAQQQPAQAANPFASPAQAPQPAGNPFAAPAQAPQTAGNPFAAPVAQPAQAANPFAQPAPASGQNPFAQQPAGAPNPNPFASPASNPFGNQSEDPGVLERMKRGNN
ncbi:MAG: hypothetical protein EOP06_02425 [Proteobacteria bacterium]|nr:MAG: hypothetical protein EOP06_02425 [Pseudomonadota bacterium]